MNIKKLLTISLILIMMTSKNTIIAFAESNDAEETPVIEDSCSSEEKNNNDTSEDAKISINNDAPEASTKAEPSKDTELDDTDCESEDTDEEKDIKENEDNKEAEEDEHHEASISIKGLVPTVVVNDEGYLSEEYCVYYESSFNAYDEMSFSEALSILINSKNNYCDAEKSALRSLNISGLCPEDLSIDVYYNRDETEVTKINAHYTSIDDDKEKIHVTLYEKDIK